MIARYIMYLERFKSPCIQDAPKACPTACRSVSTRTFQVAASAKYACVQAYFAQWYRQADKVRVACTLSSLPSARQQRLPSRNERLYCIVCCLRSSHVGLGFVLAARAKLALWLAHWRRLGRQRIIGDVCHTGETKSLRKMRRQNDRYSDRRGGWASGWAAAQ